MAETDRHEPQIYQLRVVLRGISPLIWRRLLGRIAGTSLDSTAGNRTRILMIAWTRSMMRSWTTPVTMTRTDLIDARLIARLPNWQPVRMRRLSMKFTIQVLIESPDALPLGIPIQTIERSCDRIEGNSQTISRGTDPVRVAIDHGL
jgi:hypothetical protein